MKISNAVKIALPLFMSLVLLFYGRPGFSGDCTEDGGFTITTAMGPIINGDMEQARQIAIYDAIRKALECHRIHLKGETTLSKGHTVADWTWVRAEGFIKAWELVEESSGVVGNGYRATVKSWVMPEKERDKEKRNLQSLEKILFIADTDAAKAVEKVLSAELRKTLWGVRFHDSDFVKHNVTHAVWEQLCNRNLYNLEDSAFKFEADLVIHIEASVSHDGRSAIYDLEKYSGSTVIRLFQLSGEKKGEAIVESFRSSDKLFANKGTPPAGLAAALLSGNNPNHFKRQIAEPASADFLEKLMNCELFAVPDRAITVVIHDVPSNAEYKKFLYIIKNQRGVMDRVNEISQQGNTYTLSVQFPMKSIYLQNLISQSRIYKPVGHGWNRIEFRYITP